jgi:hypothetical protein
MAELNFMHDIDVSEIIQLLNKGVLFKVRWQLSIEEGEKELARIIKEGYLKKIKLQGVYTYLSQIETALLSAQIPRSQNIFPLFAVTTGDSGKEKLLQLYKDGSFFDYFLFNGLLSELAEATAEYIENIVKKENNIQNSGRISPGYPLWKNISDQQIVLHHLKAEKIGISLTSAFQLVPEHSITGMVISR